MTPPPVPDRDSLEWWEALGRHELLLQRCSAAACRTWRWPARAMCGACGSFDWAWERAAGRGRVASWIVSRHPFLPDFPPPYVVLMVRQDEQEDLLLPGAFAGAPDDPRLFVGAEVTLGFGDLAPAPLPAGGEGALVTALLRWEPV
jgi:uncharacterized OB-fold protein